MNEDDLSDNDVLSASIMEPAVQSNFDFKGELPEDRLQYKKDKKCVCCGEGFGLGILNVKKHYCKFCYRGICAKCSPTSAFHPEDRKQLRICNLCCEKTVEDSFSAIFRAKITEIQQQISIQNKKYIQDYAELQLILKEIYKFDNLINLEHEKTEKLSNELSKISESSERSVVLKSHLEHLLSRHKIFKEDCSKADNEISNLEKTFREQINQKVLIKTQVAEMRNKLSEIQDDHLHLQTKGHKRSSSIILNEAEKKEELALNTLVIQNFELQCEVDRAKEEIDRLENENDVISKRIKGMKEAVNQPDRLVSNERREYSVDEEERVRTLRAKQRQQQTIIEKLKLDLKAANSRGKNEHELRGDEEDEEQNLSESTRPCARCIVY